MNLIEILQDFYYVNLKGYHKHKYLRIEDGITCGMHWPRYQCTRCSNIVGLNDWQIKNLPTSMKYEKNIKREKNERSKRYESH